MHARCCNLYYIKTQDDFCDKYAIEAIFSLFTPPFLLTTFGLLVSCLQERALYAATAFGLLAHHNLVCTWNLHFALTEQKADQLASERYYCESRKANCGPSS